MIKKIFLSIYNEAKRPLSLIGGGLIGFVVIALLFVFVVSVLVDDELSASPSDNTPGNNTPVESTCNVYGFGLYGEVTTHMIDESLEEDDEGFGVVSADELIELVADANNDPQIKAIWIEVDSCGGSPAGSEEMAAAVAHSDKPVVAYIRTVGASAAYWAISGADHIIALPSSDIGSIGVTASYIDYSQQNAKEGIKYNNLSSGKYKDMFDPEKVLTLEEKKLIMRDVNLLKDIFVKAISDNRKIDLEKVEALADGSSFLSQRALENKLIDQIGTYYDGQDYLKELIGEEVELCW